MKKHLTLILSIVIYVTISSCIDPCDFEYLEYIGSSIDEVDNSGAKPIRLNGNTIKSKSFGIYYQLDFKTLKNPNACIIESDKTPTSLKIYTVNKFNYIYPAGAEMTNAFKILNSKNAYPVSLINAKIKYNNHLLLYDSPSIDTLQQFVINGYRDGVLISSDTSHSIIIKR